MAVDLPTNPTFPPGESLVERLSRLSRESNLMTLDAVARMAPADGTGFAVAACQAKRLAESLTGGLTAAEVQRGQR